MPQQVWGTATQGGNLSIGQLSKKLHMAAQPLLRADQFCRPEGIQGGKRGDKVYFNKVSDLTDDDASSTTALTETQTVPIDYVTIPQGTLTLNEYGRGLGYTGKLEALAEWEAEQVFVTPLKNWMAKKRNALALNEFMATYVKYAPTGTAAAPTGTFDTDGTMTTAAARDIQAFDVYEIVEYMRATLFVPPWDGQNYFALAHASFLRKLREDADWEWAAAYANPQQLISGEIGRFHGVRFVENNQGWSPSHGKLLTAGTYKGQAVFFGEDAVAKCFAIDVEIREKVPTDFGRDKAYAGYMLGGYKIIFDATAAAGQARIVQITSAAS